jgi:hypothetical protein
MAFFKLSEPLVTALVTRLQTDLPAKVAEINAAATDGIVLPLPAASRIYDFPPQGELLTDFPVIGIQDFPSTFDDDIGSSVTGNHALGVIVWVSSADQRTLAMMLRRYCQAVTTVALEGRFIGDAWGTLLRRVYPGPTIDAEEDPRTWVSFAVVEISARRSE